MVRAEGRGKGKRRAAVMEVSASSQTHKLRDAVCSMQDGFFHLVQLRRVDGKNISEKIVLGYLDLSKFAALNPGQMKDMQFSDRQEKWGYTLANVGRMELQDLSQEDEVFRSVFEDSMHQKLTKMEKEEYKKSVLEYEDVQEAVRYARELGIEEGFGRGIEQGIEQGMRQGETNTKCQLARNMLAEGLDPAMVAKIAGLTEAEVLELREGSACG